nr:hypothetical protein CFP56_34649 [Quercus suber]
MIIWAQHVGVKTSVINGDIESVDNMEGYRDLETYSDYSDLLQHVHSQAPDMLKITKVNQKSLAEVIRHGTHANAPSRKSAILVELPKLAKPRCLATRSGRQCIAMGYDPVAVHREGRSSFSQQCAKVRLQINKVLQPRSGDFAKKPGNGTG